jgi:hypothetical protein
MDEKKIVYKSEVMALPPLRMVLGEVPSPDPVQRRRSNLGLFRNREMVIPVKRLIAHLEEKE